MKTRWEFDIYFRRKVQHALKVSQQTGEKPDLTPTPMEKKWVSSLAARGLITPHTLDQMVREEVLGVV